MSGQPWGRTGRVTLHHLPTSYEGWCVHVDRHHLGVMSGEDGDILADTGFSPHCPHPPTAARTSLWSHADAPFPTRDAAVMWVLRRAAPDVWRAERPVVYQVYQEHLIEWCDGHRGGWAIWPGSSPWGDDVWRHFPSAIRRADDLARAEYARSRS